ncbi:MAG: hypothetical protein ACHQ53_15185 [Polyangiales bacterium]
MPDLTRREGIALAPLVLLIFWIGLYPSPFLSRMQASVDHMARDYTGKLKASDANPDRRGILEPEKTAARDDDAAGKAALAAIYGGRR